MTELQRRVRAGVAAGVLATMTMDAAMFAAGSMGGDAFRSERLDPSVIGRWGKGLLRRRWRHDDASREEARASDMAAGLATHYATGVALTELYLLLPGRRSFAAAVTYGIATAVLPLFVLFPSLGYGPLGLRSGDAARLARIMLVGHAAFGAGIGLGGALVAPRR